MTHIPDDKPLTAGDLKAILRDRSRLAKNGEGWGEYFRDKWFTPQNIGWIVALVLFGYGEWRDVKSDAREAKASTIENTVNTDKLSDRVDEVAKTIEMVQTTIEANRTTTKSEIAALRVDVQTQLRITRNDLRQQIEPVKTQLQNIQKSVEGR